MKEIKGRRLFSAIITVLEQNELLTHTPVQKTYIDQFCLDLTEKEWYGDHEG
jgi:hypothetical protein